MRKIKVGLVMLGALLLMTLPVSAADQSHGEFHEDHDHDRGIIVSPYFGSRFFYDPWLASPYGWYGAYGPYGFYGTSPQYHWDIGKLKLTTNVEDADVYLNGAFAGKAEDLKTIRLRPGKYHLKVSAPGYEPLKRQIFVVRGKTLKVVADLQPAPEVTEPAR